MGTTEVHPEEHTGRRELWPGLVVQVAFIGNETEILVSPLLPIGSPSRDEVCVSVSRWNRLSVSYVLFLCTYTPTTSVSCALHLATDRQILPPSAVFHYVQRAADAFIPGQTPCVRGRRQLMKVGAGGSTNTEPWYRVIITTYTITA